MTRAPFWERPLASLDAGEWEALCDGCGQCCLHKVEDEDTGAIYPTNVACKLLDIHAARCSDYAGRKRVVPDYDPAVPRIEVMAGELNQVWTNQLSPRLAATLDWLPPTCAYRLRAADEPLPGWHYLISGDRETVHSAGISVRGKAIGEAFAGPLEDHAVLPEGVEVWRP